MVLYTSGYTAINNIKFKIMCKFMCGQNINIEVEMYDVNPVLLLQCAGVVCTKLWWILDYMTSSYDVG